jgi:hypothetical protein
MKRVRPVAVSEEQPSPLHGHRQLGRSRRLVAAGDSQEIDERVKVPEAEQHRRFRGGESFFSDDRQDPAAAASSLY